MIVDFWIANLSAARIQALEARWASPLTQAQLANPWQTVLIDGQRIPGLCSLKKAGRKLRAKVNSKAGGDGGSATIRGLENPQFKLTTQLFTPSQFDAWLALVPELEIIGKGSRTDRKSISHPLAQLCGVRSVSFLEVEYEAPEAGGPLVVTLGLLGYGQESTGRSVSTTTKQAPAPAPSVVSLPQAPQAPSLRSFVAAPGGGR